MTDQKGFTLIEVFVLVATLILLAALLSVAIDDARVRNGKILNDHGRAIEACIAKDGIPIIRGRALTDCKFK